MIALVEEVPGLASWAGSVQAAVTAIRKAGATNHMILLPGTYLSSPSSLPSLPMLLNQHTDPLTRQWLYRCLNPRLWWLRGRPGRRHQPRRQHRQPRLRRPSVPRLGLLGHLDRLHHQRHQLRFPITAQLAQGLETAGPVDRDWRRQQYPELYDGCLRRLGLSE